MKHKTGTAFPDGRSRSFSRHPAGFRLESGEVHLWTGALDRTEAECRRLMQQLSEDERARAEGFLFQEHRRRFTVRRGILRMILARYLDVSPHTLRFDHGGNGKPELAPPFRKHGITFNLSHADDIALFAFSRNRELGVDIERVRDIPEMEGIIERFFSPGEKRFIQAAPAGMRKQAFFDCWTRKEAFIKGIGAGLSLPLASFNVAPAQDGEHPPGSAAGQQPFLSDWSIRTLRPVPDHAGAIAVRGRHIDLHCFTWTPAVVHSFMREHARGETA